jgi:transposase-like protein
MSRVTQDDVLFGYRLQVFELAGRTSVSEACRTFGIQRSTYYAWKDRVERGGLEMLRPRERRRPQMPNQLPAIPRYSGLRRELETYLRYYNFDRVHHGRLTRGRIPAGVVRCPQDAR